MKTRSGKKIRSLGILVHFETREIGGYFKEVLAGVLTALEGTPFDLKLITGARFPRIQPLFARHGVSGILIPAAYRGVFPHLTAESRNAPPRWPVVTMNDLTDELKLAQFGIDSRAAMKELTGRLIRRGYRRFIFLGRKKGLSADAEARREGFLEALREAGIGFRPECFADGYFSEERAYRQTLKFLCRPLAGKTALVCANDAMALGALRALRQRGLDCPGDAGVTGFDGLPETAASHPPLTTVRMPLRRIAEAACRHLLSLVRGSKGPAGPCKRYLPYEVLLRPSI